MRTSSYTEIKSGIEIEICQVRGVQYSSKRRLQFRATDYNSDTVTVNKKTNNDMSISVSYYQTIKNLNVYRISEIRFEYLQHITNEMG